jgi:hypothetical protein
MQYRIRRSWGGDRYYVGPATIRYENGNIAVAGHVDGLEEHSISFGCDDEHVRYWHEDGRKLNSTEWFFYMSREYIPRHMNGELIGTEKDWRRMNAEFEKEHPEWVRSPSH